MKWHNVLVRPAKSEGMNKSTKLSFQILLRRKRFSRKYWRPGFWLVLVQNTQFPLHEVEGCRERKRQDQMVEIQITPSMLHIIYSESQQGNEKF